ncbi:MAG: hypothetical protein WBD16_08875 [Pyrinomonadaceae bacterium]
MSRILFFVLFLCTPLSLAAQKSETFESISFQTPKDWQKEVGKESVQFAAENADGGLCLITMFKPIAGSGNAKTDFGTAWESVVQSTVKAGKPQMNPAGNDDGWAIENGAAPYESDGRKGVAMLITATGNSKLVVFLILTNTDAFEPAISSFIGSVKLPKIEPPAQAKSSVAARNDGYRSSTVTFDDGWTSTAQDDWVLVSKGQMKVHLLYALPYNASQFSGTGVRARDFYWDNYVAKYFGIQSKQYREESSIGSFNAEYVEGTATDRQTGKRRFIAMYLSISPNTAWLKVASAPNEGALRQQFPKSHLQLDSDLSAMSRFNQFPVSASDVAGRWQDGNTSTAHWYYVSPTGYESYAGMTIASTAAEFNFAPSGSYTSQHTGATGSVGNLSGFKQTYRGTYKVTDWSLSATNRWQGKTDIFKAYFQVMRGGRVLVLESAGQTYNLVRTR